MISVDVFEHDGAIIRFKVSGHAGYGHAGEDIVCAAVSALVYNAINSAERFLSVQLAVQDEGDTLKCEVTRPQQSAELQLLLQSMVYGIVQTAELYPQHVTVNQHFVSDVR